MNLVLFCGGYGMRMRDGVTDIPKPMTTVGPRPLIWHVMRYYAYYGHTDFVLCLGYGAEHIKQYFLDYAETTSNDFVLRGGEVELLSTDIRDWTITFVHTGLDSPIGERLRRVRQHVQDEEIFLANYADVLTDLPLNDMIDTFKASGAVGALTAVPPQSAFHCVEIGDDDRISSIHTLQQMPLWENGGYFALRPEIFDHLPENGDLIADACVPLAQQGRMLAYRHRGFWHPADTPKERTALEAMYRSGNCPWMPWTTAGRGRDAMQSAIAGLVGGGPEHER
jgi:glucose-1-phosphate cytidylyltransferase